MKYVIYAGITVVSFVVASVASSLITGSIGPGEPSGLKPSIEPRIGDPKPQQQPPKPEAAQPPAPKPKVQEKAPAPPADEQPAQAQEEAVQVSDAPRQPRPAPAPRATGPGNLDLPPRQAPVYQRGPGNIDSGYTPIYTPRPVQIGPGNL